MQTSDNLSTVERKKKKSGNGREVQERQRWCVAGEGDQVSKGIWWISDSITKIPEIVWKKLLQSAAAHFNFYCGN